MSRSAKRIPWCVALLIALTAIPLGARPQDADGEEGEDGKKAEQPDAGPARLLLGSIKKSEGEIAELQVGEGGRGLWQLKLDASATIFHYEAATLGTLPSGTKAHVLGRRVRTPIGEGGHTVIDEYIQVQSIVSGDEFRPPPLTAEQKLAKVEWYGGVLTRTVANQPVRIDQYEIRTGYDREAVRIRGADRSDLRRKAMLFVSGTADESTKPPTVVARRIVVLDPKLVATKHHKIVLPPIPPPPSKK